MPTLGSSSSTAASSWRALTESATRTIDALERRTTELRRQTQRIVASKDATRAKQSLRDTREADGDLLSGARETLRRIETHIQASPGDAVVGAALGKAAVDALDGYESSSMAMIRRIQAVQDGEASNGVGTSRSSRGGVRRTAIDPADDEDEDESSTLVGHGYGRQPQQQQQRQEHFSVDLYDDIMRERSREVAELAENIRDIHEIFSHINVMVGEQGEQLVKADETVDAALNDVTRGNVELKEAERQQTSNRNMRCYIFALLLILGVLFLVTVALK